MRNLKKILALVLALVMSLSLMATAGAKDFGDSDQVNANYKTAIDVLSELKVFGGYDDGTFKPQQNITRAEVAAIIYRIATGDVMGDKVALYSDMANSKLADLNQAEWARGQINYCYNAGIIKGVNNTDFEPNANVTGYAALTMILRALGYGQNGEFVGDQWEMNTASRARELGLLDKISEGQLGAPATREMVAEILFRTMLKETVTWTALQGYQTTGTTLGYQTFKLRDVTGVVVANKWANLNSSKVLADGKTDVVITGETKSTRIDLDTELTDIGEARHFYLAGDTSANVLAMDEEGVNNNVYSNEGNAAKVSDSKITVNADTEQFINFDFTHEGKSDYRLEYSITFDNNKVFDKLTSQEWFEDKYGVDPDDVIATKGNTRLDTETVSADGKVVTYTRVIPRNDGISAEDIAIMDGIFSVADNDDSKSAGIDGYVYAGTNSTSSVDRSRDLSDEMNWNDFYDTYIASRANTKVGNAANGEWLKVVDNDSDGVAEYVFLTEFHLDKALSSHTVKGEDEPVLDYYKLTSESKAYSVRELTDDLAVGDVVIYALIDGKANVSRAEKLTDKVATINFKDVTLTTDGGETKKQSGIDNDTEMAEIITNMATKTEYDMYLDAFGHVRAYELAAGTQYGLVTEAYYGFGSNGSFVRNGTVTVELASQDEEIQEYRLLNTRNNPFVLDDYYSQGVSYNNINLYNYLQPAISHLGTSYMDTNWGYDWDNNNTASNRGDDTIAVNNSIFKGNNDYNWWANPGRRTVRALETDTSATDVTIPAAFDFGGLWIGNTHHDHRVSLTNIASYTMEEDGVNLYSAAKLAIDKQGNPVYRVNVDDNTVGTLKRDARVTETEWKEAWTSMPGHSVQNADMDFKNALDSGELLPIYAVDYVQLDTGSIAKGAQHYAVDDHDDIRITSTAAEDNYKTLNNRYINAIHSTQYYIVDGSGQTYITDYVNLPAIDGDKIYAAYAVATNTNADKDGVPYWVADVIVIEVDDWTDYNYHSISAAYRNTLETNGKVRYLETLNNESEDPELTVIPSELGWGTEWDDFGFYRLFDAEMDGDELVAQHIAKITKDWNSYGIYAGEILRMESVLEKGDYFDVQLAGTGNSVSGVKAFAYGPAYVIDGKDAKNVHFNNSTYSDVKEGDEVIVVLSNDKSKTAYVIDVSKDFDDILKAGAKVPSWLVARNSDGDPISGVYAAIETEQKNGPTTDTVTITVKRGVVDNAGDTDLIKKLSDVKLTYAKGSVVNLPKTALAVPGYDLDEVCTDKFGGTEINDGDDTVNLGLTQADGTATKPLTADATIYASYIVNTTQTLTLNTGDLSIGDIATNITLRINNKAAESWNGSIKSGLTYGDSFTINFKKSNFYSEYEYKIGSGDWVTIGAGVNTITGTIEGATVVYIRATKGDQTTIALEKNGNTVDGITNGAVVFVGQTLEIDVTAKGAHSLTANSVAYTISGTDGTVHYAAVKTNTSATQKTYSLPITSDMAGKVISVNVIALADAGYTVTLAAPDGVKFSLNGTPKANGENIKVTGNGSLTVGSLNGDKMWITVDDATKCGKFSAEGVTEVTIPNIIGDISVTISTKAPSNVVTAQAAKEKAANMAKDYPAADYPAVKTALDNLNAALDACVTDSEVSVMYAAGSFKNDSGVAKAFTDAIDYAATQKAAIEGIEAKATSLAKGVSDASITTEVGKLTKAVKDAAAADGFATTWTNNDFASGADNDLKTAIVVKFAAMIKAEAATITTGKDVTQAGALKDAYDAVITAANGFTGHANYDDAAAYIKNGAVDKTQALFVTLVAEAAK